jgi:hypothetical protein
MQHRTNIFINTIKLYFVNTVKSHFVNIQILLFAYNIHSSIALHIPLNAHNSKQNICFIFIAKLMALHNISYF